ncbi:CU044_2847 family protein [Streptomyces sp. NPDC058612]|uniref:CU044_2847 family protein n=1 Tax=Streptomyces sp. NPDC058612 TaxID=3346555 RepID=UPI00364879DC
MEHLVTIPLDHEDGGVAVFEVSSDLQGSDLELAASGDLATRARVTLQEALDQVRPTLARVSEMVRELAPQEAEIEFGLKMGGETGVVIAKGTAEVNFAVRLVWTRP